MPQARTEYSLHGQLDGSPVKLNLVLSGIVDERAPRRPSGPILWLEYCGRTYEFGDDRITVTRSPVGALQTVAVEVVPDLGTVLISILVPEQIDPVRIGSRLEVHLAGVKTTVATPLAGTSRAGGYYSSKSFNMSGQVRCVPGSTDSEDFGPPLPQGEINGRSLGG